MTLETAVERKDRLEGDIPGLVELPLDGEAVIVNRGDFCLKAVSDLNDGQLPRSKLTVLRRREHPAVVVGRQGQVAISSAQNLNLRPEEIRSITFGQYSLSIKEPQDPSSITVELRSFDRKPFSFSSFNLDKLKGDDRKKPVKRNSEEEKKDTVESGAIETDINLRYNGDAMVVDSLFGILSKNRKVRGNSSERVIIIVRQFGVPLEVTERGRIMYKDGQINGKTGAIKVRQGRFEKFKVPGYAIVMDQRNPNGVRLRITSDNRPVIEAVQPEKVRDLLVSRAQDPQVAQKLRSIAA